VPFVIIIIIIIISPQIMKIMTEWGDLECLHKAYKTAITVGSLFTDTGINE